MDKDKTGSPSVIGGLTTRTVWMLAGVLAAASLAAGAGMVMRKPASTPVPEAAPAAATLAAEAPKPAAKPQPVKPAAAKPAAAKPVVQAAATVCADCGVVAAVHAVKRKGQASGVGAVAGGVLGAVVGNQFGKGSGRSAMTVLGAVGGGVAGNEIEKQSKAVVVYQVTVKMDDGSQRSVEVAKAPQVGERVVVQGNRLKPAG